tara:strand:+ start:37 stop:579 length:543 start_codon:yes stop_codon:yes gene_type:complete
MNFLKRICCKRSSEKNYSSGVYRLKLYDNKYYIGKSNNINKRIWRHSNDNGSAWTKKYNVIDRMSLLTDCKDSKLWELEETLENMCIFGIENVRGSMFSKTILSNEEKIKAAQLYCEMYDLCILCGSDKHFVKDCVNDCVKPWVDKFGGKLTVDIRKCFTCSKEISNSPKHYKYCSDCFN